MGQAPATIRVTRDKTRGKDRRRPYSVYVDQIEAGHVGRGQTKDFPVQPGTRLVRTSIDFEHSRDWQATLADGDVIAFVCRGRGKKSGDRVDLFLVDPSDRRAAVRPTDDDSERDMARKQRVVTRDGQVLAVWAHRSGYLRSFDPGQNSSSGDGFLLELAIYIFVLPVLCLLRWVRHRLLFKRGWSVGAVRRRRLLWPKKVRLERFGSEGEARARAATMVRELENWP